jgi:hypothetical protein
MLPTGQVIAAALMVLAGAAGERTSDAPDLRSARDAFVGLLDARGVAFVHGSGPALYLESGGGRWLCVTRGATGPRCHAWPTGAPRLATISNGYADDRTLFYGTTADADLELRVDSVTDDVSVFKITCKSDGRPLDFTVPPSRRPKRRPLRCNRDLDGAKLAEPDVELPRIVAAAFAALPDQSEGSGAGVTSVEHQGYGVVSVGGETQAGWDQERWTCMRSPGGKRACGETQYATFQAIQPALTLPAAWLLMVESSAGRGGDVALVWAAARDGKLATAALDVGGIDAYGEGCRGLPSYCVDVSGAWVDWKMLSPACVRIGRTVRWKATHVRAQHRWIHERILPPHRKAPADDEDGDDDPAPLAPGTYSPGPDGWQRSGCNGQKP